MLALSYRGNAADERLQSRRVFERLLGDGKTLLGMETASPMPRLLLGHFQRMFGCKQTCALVKVLTDPENIEKGQVTVNIWLTPTGNVSVWHVVPPSNKTNADSKRKEQGNKHGSNIEKRMSRAADLSGRMLIIL
ncbi:hypothetical protein BELL_0349g00060 [Botrytis elliptica]|uniref:Uncharacterized protein n=1 Tax=Botrytis elliptica TaxID=278938 RepID=A0A4Z1JPR6_9HELO|nr:hypothetical protein BELL_0349g00060 [Botrytis elliptica]